MARQLSQCTAGFISDLIRYLPSTEASVEAALVPHSRQRGKARRYAS